MASTNCPSSSFCALLILLPAIVLQASSLEELARPQEGRSMRATSTMRLGEIVAGRERKPNPKAE